MITIYSYIYCDSARATDVCPLEMPDSASILNE